MLDVTSVALPPHAIFTGVNLAAWVGSGITTSDPPLLGAATALALFTNGQSAVAINASGTVIGINLFGQYAAGDADIAKLTANAALFLAGEL
jgi:hypothetical protein